MQMDVMGWVIVCWATVSVLGTFVLTVWAVYFGER